MTQIVHGHCRVRNKRTRTYLTWDNMLQRCRNPRNTWYKNYGGRGIKVCERWSKFENFLADMGERPPGRTIDRKDNDGDYEPDNCRWATKKEQSNNHRRNRYLTCYDGPKGTKTLTEWAAISGRHYTTILHALKRGWTHKEAVFGRPRRYT